jgi:hypothetical protein
MLQVRQVAEENGVDVSNQIKELEERAKQVGACIHACFVQVAVGGRGLLQRVAAKRDACFSARMPNRACTGGQRLLRAAEFAAISRARARPGWIWLGHALCGICFPPAPCLPLCPAGGSLISFAYHCPATIRHCRVQLRKDTYNRLTPIQRLQVARHPNRPTFLDIALNISDKASRLKEMVLRAAAAAAGLGCCSSDQCAELWPGLWLSSNWETSC